MTATHSLTSIEKQLLEPLRESILNKPRYIRGTCRLPASRFSLFYRTTKDSHAARFINLADASVNELEQLVQACEPASLHVLQKGVKDELYHNVGKMGSGSFGPLLALDQTNLSKLIEEHLFDGRAAGNRIWMELHELNVYSEGSFTKPHVETAGGENMVGSLVVVFPTPHEGGALLVRHGDQEWTFDPDLELTSASARMPMFGYVALLKGVEHEVAPVTSGHRVTLKYLLYVDVDGPLPAEDPASGPFSLTVPERAFRESFEALLENPEFLPEGGTLGFGLRHIYPVGSGIKHVYGMLKASDAVVYRSFRALGFQPVLYMYYEREPYDFEEGVFHGALIDHRVDFREENYEESDLARILPREGGLRVYRRDSSSGNGDRPDYSEKIDWVTPVTTFSRQETAYIHYGNEPSLEMAYWDLCLVVRIGKAGERLMYQTIAQIKKETDNETPWESFN